MYWRRGEIRTIQLGQYRRRRGSKSQTITYSKYEIPAPYDRIVSQLIAEDMHAMGHDTHESRRRQTYAVKTLDTFGDELKELKRSSFIPANFRLSGPLHPTLSNLSAPSNGLLVPN